MSGEQDAASGDAQVHSITDAATAHSEEMRQRMIKYAVAMGIRLVCLLSIFVVDGWFKIIAVAGAVFLPWIAVIIANGSDKAEIHSDYLLDSAPLAEIEASGNPAAEDNGPTVLQGELIEDADDNDGQERAAS
jgi:predicted tellurium resistance membrane protein TerC